MTMPTKEQREKRIFITVPLYPVDKARLEEIVRIARQANPKFSASEAIRKMIGDLYGGLWRAGLLPSTTDGEEIDPMRGNGHRNVAVEQ